MVRSGPTARAAHEDKVKASARVMGRWRREEWPSTRFVLSLSLYFQIQILKSSQLYTSCFKFQIFLMSQLKSKYECKPYYFKCYYFILLPIFDSNNNWLYYKILFSFPNSQSTIITIFVYLFYYYYYLFSTNFRSYSFHACQSICFQPTFLSS